MGKASGLAAEWLSDHASTNTRAAYRRDLDSFFGWCAATGRVPLRTTDADLDAYRDDCLEGGSSNATVARRLSGVASFFRYVRRAGATGAANPVDGVARPSPSPADETQNLDDHEVNSILEVACSHGPRTAALIGLLAREGVKLGEALALDVAAVRKTRKLVTLDVVRRGQTTTLEVAGATGDALTRCVGGRPTGPLFVGKSPARAEGVRLTRFGADFLIKRVCAAAQIDKVVSANSLLRAHRAGIVSPGEQEVTT